MRVQSKGMSCVLIYLLAPSSLFTHWLALGKWISFFATWHNGGFASKEGWGEIAGGKNFAFWFWSAGQQAPLALPHCSASPLLQSAVASLAPASALWAASSFPLGGFAVRGTSLRIVFTGMLELTFLASSPSKAPQPMLCHSAGQGCALSYTVCISALRWGRAFSMVFPLSFKGSDCSWCLWFLHF